MSDIRRPSGPAALEQRQAKARCDERVVNGACRERTLGAVTAERAGDQTGVESRQTDKIEAERTCTVRPLSMNQDIGMRQKWLHGCRLSRVDNDAFFASIPDAMTGMGAVARTFGRLQF